LPNAEEASIPAAKLRDYVLNESHPDNQGKARVFEALGYAPDIWEQLAADLRTQHLTKDAVEGKPSGHGRRYLIEAPLTGPSGRANIRSVWQIDHGGEVPRFITAYPNE
jgi:Domain of unknown function (DUF6883)